MKYSYLIERADSLEKTTMLGKIEGRRRRGWQRIRWLNGIINSMDMSLSKLWEGQGSLVCCSPWGCKELDSTGQLDNKHTFENLYKSYIHNLMNYDNGNTHMQSSRLDLEKIGEIWISRS